MSKILLILTLAMSVFISACNSDDDAEKEPSQPTPQPNCKMHCAP